MGLQIFCWLQEISLSSWYKTQNRNNFRPRLIWDTNETNCAILYRKHHTQTLHTAASYKVLQFNYSNYTYQIKLLKLSWTTLNCISSPTEIKLGTIYTHFTFVYSLLHGFIWNQHNDQLPVGLLARLVGQCTGNEEVMGSNPVQAWIFFKPYFHYCSIGVHYCEDRFHIHVFIRSSNIWLSYLFTIFYNICVMSSVLCLEDNNIKRIISCCQQTAWHWFCYDKNAREVRLTLVEKGCFQGHGNIEHDIKEEKERQRKTQASLALPITNLCQLFLELKRL